MSTHTFSADRADGWVLTGHKNIPCYWWNHSLNRRIEIDWENETPEEALARGTRPPARVIPSVERGCTGKVNLGRRYIQQAERLSLKHGKRYGVYRCPHCGGAHLTTKLDIAEKYFEPLLYVCEG